MYLLHPFAVAIISAGQIVQIPVMSEPGYPEDAKAQVEGIRDILSDEQFRVETCCNPDCMGCSFWVGAKTSPAWKEFEQVMDEIRQELRDADRQPDF